MARPLRIQYPGAVYHAMARGNQGRPIFRDDQDRRRFLETLAEACEKTGWEIHAYVLMGNHYHLLVRTPEPNLVEGMKLLQGAYTFAVAPAWWLRQRTTVSLRWVSERLGMGHYTRVTKAVSRMRSRPGRKLARLQRKLLRMNGEGGV